VTACTKLAVQPLCQGSGGQVFRDLDASGRPWEGAVAAGAATDQHSVLASKQMARQAAASLIRKGVA